MQRYSCSGDGVEWLRHLLESAALHLAGGAGKWKVSGRLFLGMFYLINFCFVEVVYLDQGVSFFTVRTTRFASGLLPCFV